jgi:hypothetical protein
MIEFNECKLTYRILENLQASVTSSKIVTPQENGTPLFWSVNVHIQTQQNKSVKKLSLEKIYP